MKNIIYIIITIALSGLSRSYAQSDYIAGLGVEDTACYTGSPSDFTVIAYGEMGIFDASTIADYSAKIFWGDGTDDDIALSPTYYFGITETHTYTSPGTYSIRIIVYHLGAPVDSSEIAEYNSYCRIISGQTYLRGDSDCIPDPGENVVYFPSHIELRKGGMPIDTIDCYGGFYYNIPSPDYTVEYELVPLDFAASGFSTGCPSATYKFRLDTLDYPENVFSYALDCDASVTGFDLYTGMYGFLRVSTGPSYLYLPAGNMACSPTNGQLTLQLSPKYTFASASVTPTSVSGSTVTWDLTGLGATYTEYLTVTLNPVGILTLGDTAIFHASIMPTSGDVDTSNNFVVYSDTIRAAFDPNEKHVSPSGYIEAGQELTYTIHFENLGTDTAFNIHIIDQLSDFLDASTFRLAGASHLAYPIFYEKDGHQYLKFDLPDIKLPDASHPESNKGFVSFRMQAKATMAPGDVIENSADIFFDFNPAVVTNTVYSEIGNPSSAPDITIEGMKVYPNPATGVLYVDIPNDDFDKLTITNITGRQVIYEHVRTGTNVVNIAPLPAGVYMINLSGKSLNAQNIRIVIKK